MGFRQGGYSLLSMRGHRSHCMTLRRPWCATRCNRLAVGKRMCIVTSACPFVSGASCPVSGGATASFAYDGDGNRVKGTVNGVTTAYVGNYYELSGSTTRKYYYAGSTRVAMTENGALSWLLSDHLGSTSVTVNSGGSKTGELRYSAFGGTRYTCTIRFRIT